MALEEGDVLGGYRIVRLIGRGGMGAVYLADDVRLGRKVALKVLAPELAEQPRVRERFVRESQLAASLDHPHILPIYEAGEAGGRLFIAMRYVPGPDLEGIIARDGPLPLERTVAVVDQVASALDAAHGAGLIHRDVKPGNVLVAPGSQPGTDHAYLSDFGLTKHAEYATTLTRSGQLMGSVGYVAPEQIESRPIDRRADVYSLGCVLFECLAGVPPYRRDTDMATLYAHAQAPLPSLAEARPELADALDPVIARAMAKAPEGRYETAGELARALSDVARPDAARHRTRGFLFADLRGYTAYVEAHGDEAAAQLLETYRQLVRDVVRRSGGAEIKTEGDSFYVVFPAASDAVRGGLAIVAAAAASSAAHPERPISVGIGVHAGETADTGEGYVGSAVNLAARLCAQAAPGEVLVSDTVRGLTRTSREVTFTSRGRKHLKGIAEPLAVYAATPPTAGAEVGGTPPARAGTTTRLAGFGRERRRVALVGAGGIGAVALLALLVAGGLGGALGASPSPGGGGASGGSGSAAASPTAIADTRIAWYQEYVDDLKDVPACTPEMYGRVESHIWLMRPDGSEPVRLMPESNVWEWSPTWSPDGTKLAFHANEQTSENTIWVVRASGADAARLPTEGAGGDYAGQIYARPTWSADGKLIAFLGGATMTDAGALTGSTTLTTVLADGSHKSLVRVDVASSTKVTPAPGATRPVSQSFDAPAWSPGGDLTFIVRNGDANTQSGGVAAIKADGSGYTELPLSVGNVLSVAWSPDGSRVALAARSFDSPVVNIWIANADTSGIQKLTDGFHDLHPTWSPDGRQIAFASDRDGHFEIYRMDRDGANVRRLTNTPASLANCDPAWGAPQGPVASATPSGEPGASSAARTFHRGRLEAGTYIDRVFEPAMRFTLGPGWQGQRTYIDGWAIRRPELPRSELDIAKVQVVDDEGGCPAARSGTQQKTRIVSSAREFVKWLQGTPHLVAKAPFAINLGGYSGLSVDVTDTGPSGCQVGSPIATYLFALGEDSVSLRPGDVVRLICLEVRGSLIVLIAGGQKGTEFLPLAQPVIDSISFPSP